MTAAFVAGGVVASVSPVAAGLCLYDRAAVADGDGWRLLSAHLVHSSGRMAAWDLGAIALLGWKLEHGSRTLLVVLLGVSALGVGLTVHHLLPELARFHGASGVASALFAAVAVDMARADHPPRVRFVARLALLAFLGKTVWEVGSERAVFAGVEVVPVAHLAGAVIGLAVALLGRARVNRVS